MTVVSISGHLFRGNLLGVIYKGPLELEFLTSFQKRAPIEFTFTSDETVRVVIQSLSPGDFDGHWIIEGYLEEADSAKREVFGAYRTDIQNGSLYAKMQA